MVVSYKAKRSFTGGAVLDDTIVRNLPASDLTEGRKVFRAVQTSIGGAREVTYDRGENTWAVTHKPIVIGSIDELQLRMFLDSVESGQTFSFAPYDESTDSPIAFRNVFMQSDGWQASRVLKKGGTSRGAVDYVQHSFTVVEVP